MQALQQRTGAREFGPEQPPSQALSNLPWAAWGIYRDGGRHRRL